MRAEQSVSPPRRNQLAGSTAFHGRSGRFYLAEDARRGNHDLTTAGHPGNVGLIEETRRTNQPVPAEEQQELTAATARAGAAYFFTRFYASEAALVEKQPMRRGYKRFNRKEWSVRPVATIARASSRN